MVHANWDILWSNKNGVTANNSMVVDTTKYRVFAMLTWLNQIVFFQISSDIDAYPFLNRTCGTVCSLYTGASWIPVNEIVRMDVYKDHIWLHEIYECSLDGVKFTSEKRKIYALIGIK